MQTTEQSQVQQFLQNIQPFRIIEWKTINKQKLLGKGSYGKVYIVQIPNCSQVFAMKLLALDQYIDDETSTFQYETISREIQVLHSCSHPNILPLYGISINYQATPFEIGILTPLEWGSLAKLLDLLDKGLASEDNLPPGIQITNDIKQKIIFGISAGLYYLSTKKIIHRDIKPENILLDKDFNPLLCDFGMAKENNAKGSLSQSRSFGTPLYLAPEVFSGGHYTEKVDIYSWAFVINSILMGQTPWKEEFEHEKLTPYTFPLEVIKGKRPTIIEGEEYKIYQDLIQRGWDGDPGKRPKPEEIIEELMKDEAMLQEVNKERFKEYAKNALKNIPEYFMNLIEKLQIEKEKEKKKHEEEIQKQKKINEKYEKDIQKLNQLINTLLKNNTNTPEPIKLLPKFDPPNQNNTEAIKKFNVKYEKDPDYQKDSKFTKLHFAAKINDSTIGEILILISKGADINAKYIENQNIIILFLIKII